MPKTTIYRVDEPALVREWEPGEYPAIEWLQRAVSLGRPKGESFVALVCVGDKQVYFDEDGEMWKLPVNESAARVLGPVVGARGGVLLGAVVVLDGFPDPDRAVRMIDPGDDLGEAQSVAQKSLAPHHRQALIDWANESERPGGCSGWGPKFDAAMEAARSLRD